MGASAAAASGITILDFVEWVNFKNRPFGLENLVGTTLASSASIVQRDYDFSVNLAPYDEALLRLIAKRMRTQAERMRSDVGIVLAHSRELASFL